jgi:hypothetical protein
MSASLCCVPPAFAPSPVAQNWFPFKAAATEVNQTFSLLTVLTALQAANIATLSAEVAPSGSGELTLNAMTVDLFANTLTLEVSGGQSTRIYSILFIAALQDGETIEWIIYQGIAPGLCGYPVPVPPNPGYGAALVWTAPTNLFANGRILSLTNPYGWPKAATGLQPGNVWANGYTVSAVAGAVPNPFLPGVFFGSISANELLLIGAGNFPLYDPQVVNQLWLNGTVVYISAGPSSTGLENFGGFLALPVTTGWPTAGGGTAGTLFAPTVGPSFIYVNPGFTYVPAAAVYFGGITSGALLALGGIGLPQSDPHTPNQIWNNGNILCVSSG